MLDIFFKLSFSMIAKISFQATKPSQMIWARFDEALTEPH